MREMKDSGVVSIGMIPVEWKAIKLKFLFGDGNEGLKIGPFGSAMKGKTLESGEYKIYNQAHLINNDFSLNRHFVSEETFQELRNYEVKPGDVLFSMMGTIGKCRIMPEGYPKGIMDSHLLKAGLNLNIVHPQYFVYAYDKDYSSQVIEQLLYSSNGTIMNGLNSTILKNVKIAMPYSLGMQRKIVNYLDTKCSKIDEIIEKQQVIIEKLKEYKLSIITEAVTSGINPDVELKDSTIDMCEQIPVHWSISQNRYLFSLRDEKNYKPLEEVRLLSLYTDLGVFPHGEQEERGNKAVKAEGYKVVYENDIVVNIILAWMGAIGRSAYDGVTSPAYDIYKPNENVCSRYYHYLYRTKPFSAECYKYGRGIMAMRWRTYSSEFKSIKVPVPPYIEQCQIADYLDSKCEMLDKTIADRNKAIEKLQEYKKSLIYEVVTGKKEV